jgi:glutamate N-acetyltransferase/amino-acid N-acetyltransferase
MRYKGRPDLGIMFAESFCSCAAVFTKNLCQAAPVIWSRERFRKGRAVLANAGQANAQTGEKGLQDAKEGAAALGALLKIPTDEVLVASTGVIGAPMNMEALLKALPKLAESLGSQEKDFEAFSRAILTTDTCPKTAEAEVDVNGAKGSIWGCAKGSGMIAPDMATMLAFILTDVKVEGGLLQRLLGEAVDSSFNRLTVDGDMSTNDSVFLLSSGALGGEETRDPSSKEALAFKGRLQEVLTGLAIAIARDGEGATKFVTVRVKGARSASEADMAARAIAGSPLCKTAFYGSDPNWGRFMAALGRSGARFDPNEASLYLDGVHFVKNGADNGKEEEAAQVMKGRSFTLTADLRSGEAEAFIYTCDLSHDYISINADYRS